MNGGPLDSSSKPQAASLKLMFDNSILYSVGYCKQQKGNSMKDMYQIDSTLAFENAISKGLNNPGDFMYMYSKDNKDYFKHIIDRSYINFNNKEKDND